MPVSGQEVFLWPGKQGNSFRAVGAHGSFVFRLVAIRKAACAVRTKLKCPRFPAGIDQRPWLAVPYRTAWFSGSPYPRFRLARNLNKCRIPRTGNVRSTVRRLQHRYAEDGEVISPVSGPCRLTIW